MKISEIIAKLKEAQKTHGDAVVQQHGYVLDRVEVNSIDKNEVELGIVVKID